MKRIVILGHSGFVGNNIFHFLHKKYPAVEIIGKSSNDIDLTSEEQTQKLQQCFNLDTVVIMTSGIKSNYGNDLSTFHKNVVMAENVCKILSTYPVRKFIFLSSIAVYGVDSNNTAITEKTPVITDSYYGLSKYISEELLALEFLKCKDSSLIIVRTPTIYGPHEKITAATPSGFLTTYLQGGEVTLWGDGSDLREFLFIDDLVKAIDLLIFSDFSGVLNIGDGLGNSYTEAVNFISQLLGKKLSIHSKERSKQKVDKIYDSSLFKSLFPDFLFTPLEKGLQAIIDTYNYNSNNNNNSNNKDNIGKECNLCQQKAVKTLLDLGLQPVSNRYVHNPAVPEQKFPLRFGQCQSCGVAQLTQPMPVEELTPHYDWITYIEPEEHLDSVAATIKNCHLTSDSKICGISFKDKSLLERMNKAGFNNTLVLDPQRDLNVGIHDGIEKIQSAVTVHKARQIVQRYGQFDVVIARHILEHAYDLAGFIAALKELIAPGGYLVIEVPDCARAFERNDYPILWEEHLSYFTPTTFQHVFQH
ncbi:MAG: NAD-dependent epimerase/dehydratase family protein, partial [Nanoarchaeota archaeon]|nr:NAD-dependent epimerase/dehydratase family protein [Nanoarchaeota archaeon]